MKSRALMIPLVATLLAATLTSTPALSGTVYRWVDDEGNVQFSDNPPPGREAQDTGQRTRSNRPEPAKSASAAGRDEEKTKDNKPEDQTSEASPELPPLTPEEKEELARQHKDNCKAAREALQTMDNYARLRVEEDGEMRYLTPEEIKKRRKRMEGIREESCNWSPDA